MERPTGVTILAVVAFIFGAAFALGALGMFLGGAVLSRMGNSGGLGMLAGVGGAVLGVVCLGFAAVYIVDAMGLLKVANWARILTIILVGLSLLRSTFGMTCVQCDNELIAPEWSEYRSKHQNRHLWRCWKCDCCFETIVNTESMEDNVPRDDVFPPRLVA